MCIASIVDLKSNVKERRWKKVILIKKGKIRPHPFLFICDK